MKLGARMKTDAPTPQRPGQVAAEERPDGERAPRRVLGVDAGTDTVKVVELIRGPRGWEYGRRERREHEKDPGGVLLALLQSWDWEGVDGAAVTGACQGLVNLPTIPTKRAQSRGVRHLLGERPATVVSIGSHGFSVLELHADGLEVFRQNSRCSQGTGNFLRQLLERLSLSVEEADALAAEVTQPAVLSARCPVILKTDVTHLANRGEEQPRIVAGCFDAVGENIQAFIKPGSSPSPVVLIGGVAQSQRVQQTFRTWLGRVGMAFEALPEDSALYVEALGCALLAAENSEPPPPLSALLSPPEAKRFERLPALRTALEKVRRLAAVPPSARVNGEPHPIFLGLDIGSTGSKAVAIDQASGEVVWQAYRPTLGNPVGAAQALVREFVGEDALRTSISAPGDSAGTAPRAGWRVLGVGVTGSGREIVGALLATCHGGERVFILNEIAAHAAGAVSHDPRVDTIFEIGGQDAKYIRLEHGRVVDCAMNEACSAGTGSFLEEQGRKFSGVREVQDLEREALQADYGISLGQHCSVFMAEMIDQAVAAGVDQRAIIAGLYDSVIQNYLHRVKGNRPVGRVVFCQGMPFSSSALAAAVARQTGVEVIVPPHPGLVGAVGIARLARERLGGMVEAPLELGRFLAAEVARRDTFQCGSNRGCGGAGQHCRIERLCTRVEGKEQRFTWGGGCGLHDRAFQGRKLPDRTPDPFRERDALVEEIAARLGTNRGGQRVALSDEFMLKTHYPFFARFLYELGWDVVTVRRGGQAALKRGIQLANVPFCAPMQLFHGIAATLAETGAERVFVPRIRGLPQPREDVPTVNCPVVQASADVIGWGLGEELGGRLLAPAVDFGGADLAGKPLREACRQLAAELGVTGRRLREAYRAAVAEQQQFEARCREIGEGALEFCRREQVLPVVVLGRPYTIHNTVLNSNVPAILREQGALAIPADCLDAAGGDTELEGIYWGHGRRVLGVAQRVRRSAGVYAVFCSNYSCGPDSFGLHFFAHLMRGKPFLIVETDGHSGDAGTRTRVEAFLHCVRQDQQAEAGGGAVLTPPLVLKPGRTSFAPAKAAGETLLVPWMGRASEVVAACLRGAGFSAEALPMPDTEALRLGRRHTSGKECLPMSLTLGSLLRRLEPAPDGRFAFMIPCSRGPCRLGMYHFLDELVIESRGWQDRVRVISPCDEDYFAGTPPGFSILALAGLLAQDLLEAALLEVRPTETRPGAAEAIHRRHFDELVRLCESTSLEGGWGRALQEAFSGRLFGIAPLLERAAHAFAAVHSGQEIPTILVVGEIYVRFDPFANDFIIEKLERQGIRTRLASLAEHLDYSVHLIREYTGWQWLERWLSRTLQMRIHGRLHAVMSAALAWPARTPAAEVVAAAASYLHSELEGEAVLTLGTPLHEWRHHRVDGAVNVGPLECMPTKIAEAQLLHAARREGLPTLTLAFNGEPQDSATLDSFVFEVKERFRQGRGRRVGTMAVATHPSSGLEPAGGHASQPPKGGEDALPAPEPARSAS